MPRKRYWLMKSEPEVFGIDDLAAAKQQTTLWDGVRNYQARNILRDDMQAGDEVLYYHSRNEPIGVAGTAKVVRAGYPDPTQFDPKNKYHDPKATEETPRWYCVDIQLTARFDEVVTLTSLKANAKLKDMMVVQRGARLSVQPVAAKEFREVLRMAKA